MLNDDGSGMLAGGNYSWTKEGMKISKFPEVIQYTVVTEYSSIIEADGREMGSIDYSKGGYIILQVKFGLQQIQYYALSTPSQDGFKICVRGGVTSRISMPAILYFQGGFNGRFTESGDRLSSSGKYLILDEAFNSDREVMLTYQQESGRFIVDPSVSCASSTYYGYDYDVVLFNDPEDIGL